MINLQWVPTAALTAAAIKVSLLALAFSSPAAAHPHDLLAQCQVKKDGKLVWVMCDETVHSLSTGRHVPKAETYVPMRNIKTFTIERSSRPGLQK